MKKHNSPKLELSIPEPCHEKWEEMTPVKGGRFCHQCDRHIVNFTDMSDHELAFYYQKHEGKICGVFRPDQLDRPIALPVAPTPSNKWKVAAAVAAGLLVSSGVSGQQGLEQKIIPIEQESKKGKAVKGVVIDEKGEPLIGVSILIRGTKRGTVTDIDGNFTLLIPDEYKNATLEFSYTGFAAIATETPELNENLEVTMKISNAPLEEIVVVGYGIRKDNKQKLTGRIIDIETEEPLIGANILIEGTSISCASDIEGFFELLVPYEYFEKEIIISYVGYENYLLSKPNFHKSYTLEMKPSNILPTIDIIGYKNPITQICTSTQGNITVLGALKRIPINSNVKNRKDKLLNDVIEQHAYPNPYKEQLNLMIKIDKTDAHLVSLYNLNGSLLYAQTFHLTKGEQTLTLDNLPSNLAAGSYILQVTRDNEILLTEKVVKVE